MENWKLRSILIAVVVCVLFAGCSTNSEIVAVSGDLTAGIAANEVNTSGALTDKTLSSISAFSVELFQKSVAEGKENTLISPASVLFSLGLAANGADGETLAEFEKVLGRNGLTLDELNKACKALQDSFSVENSDTEFNIANSIWMDKSFAPIGQFLQTTADYYRASVFAEDFAGGLTAQKINAWTSQKTNGHINELVDAVNPNDKAVLLNAIYFNAQWQSKFKKWNNRKLDFTLANGEKERITFMNNGETEERTFYTEEAEGVIRPYNDGRFAFFAVMPHEKSVKEFAAAFDESTIKGYIDSSSTEEIELMLPKFKVGCTSDLTGILTELGIGNAFTVDADFSRMTADGENLYISKLQQKTVLEIDENGTKAAAGTFGVMTMKAVVMQLIFDRPFVYAVVDLQTNLPIFIGVMDNPAA